MSSSLIPGIAGTPHGDSWHEPGARVPPHLDVEARMWTNENARTPVELEQEGGSSTRASLARRVEVVMLMNDAATASP